MTTTKILKSLLITALLAGATAHAADQSIVIAMEEGKQVATFKVGDWRCALADGQVRCTPGTK